MIVRPTVIPTKRHSCMACKEDPSTVPNFPEFRNQNSVRIHGEYDKKDSDCMALVWTKLNSGRTLQICLEIQISRILSLGIYVILDQFCSNSARTLVEFKFFGGRPSVWPNTLSRKTFPLFLGTEEVYFKCTFEMAHFR